MNERIFESITDQQFKEIFLKIVKESPNNYDLGARMRKFYNQLDNGETLELKEILKNVDLS
jgi:hypothetical protein